MDDTLDRVVSEEEFYRETLEMYNKFMTAFCETYEDLEFCSARVLRLRALLESGTLPPEEHQDTQDTLEWTIGYETILKNNLKMYMREVEAMEKELLGPADMTRRN